MSNRKICRIKLTGEGRARSQRLPKENAGN
jgi:hypothetical protein